MKYLVSDFSRLPDVLLLNEEHLDNNVYHKSRTAQEYIFYYILSGELCLNDNGEEVTLRSGDAYFFFKGEYHFPTCKSICNYIFLHFDGNFSVIQRDDLKADLIQKHNAFLLSTYYSNNCDKVIYLPKRFHIKSNELHKKIIRFAKENRLSAKSEKKDFYKLSCLLKTTEMFIELYRAYAEEYAYRYITESENTVNKIIGYIQNNYRQKINSSILEQRFGYNFDYMNRCFKRSTGKTIFAYLQEIRIKNAAEMLKIKNISVTRVAQECGFCDIYYFSKVFKKTYGITPKSLTESKKSAE